MRITKLSDKEIELMAKKPLARAWLQEEARHEEADLADPELAEQFAFVDLHLPVIHPWLAELAAERVAVTPAQLREVLRGGRAGWKEDGTFVVGRDAEESYPLAHGPTAVKSRLPDDDFVMTKLPVLPGRLRADHPGIDRLYQNVIHRAFTVKAYGDAPSILLEHEAVRLQQAVELLFDNRITDAPLADLHGRPLPSLADVVDAARGTELFEVAMRGAGLSVG